MHVHYSVLITIKSEMKRKSKSRLNLVFDFAITKDATRNATRSSGFVPCDGMQQLIREKPINMRKGRGRGAGWLLVDGMRSRGSLCAKEISFRNPRPG